MVRNAILRLGVIGCGRVFERLHLPAIRSSPDFRLTSCCEPAPARQDWLAATLPDVECVPDPAQMFSGPALDAVLILTPPALHAGPAIAALRAGRAVLVEKPLATTVEDARAIAAAAREAERPLLVGFNRRFRRTYRELRRRIALTGRPPGGTRPAIHYHFQADTNAWTGGVPVTGQGATSPEAHLLQDVASHQLDLIPWLTDRPIESVRARSRRARGALEIEIDVSLGGSGEPTGTRTTILAGHAPGYVERFEARFPDRRFVAYPGAVVDGTHKPGWWEDVLGRAGSAADLLRSKLAGRPSLTGESMAAQLAAFAARVRRASTEDPAADVWAGLRAVSAVAACEESLHRNGETVNVEANEAGAAASPGEFHA